MYYLSIFANFLLFFFNFFPSCSSWRRYFLSVWSLSLKRDLPHCLCWLVALSSKTRKVTQIWPNLLPRECCIFFVLFISWCFCFSYPKNWHWRPHCFYRPRIPRWLDYILLRRLYLPGSHRRLSVIFSYNFQGNAYGERSVEPCTAHKCSPCPLQEWQPFICQRVCVLAHDFSPLGISTPFLLPCVHFPSELGWPGQI